MNKNIFAVAALAALAVSAACSKNEQTSADTMVRKGVDTVSGGAVVPTKDTIVKTTTVTTDTIHGSATDSAKARADSIAKADSAKKATKKKP